MSAYHRRPLILFKLFLKVFLDLAKFIVLLFIAAGRAQLHPGATVRVCRLAPPR